MKKKKNWNDPKRMTLQFQSIFKFFPFFEEYSSLKSNEGKNKI